jgi:alpha-N-arabinofuranosidase
MDELEPFIQDSLDLVEFANGPPDSPWGARRAAMGHPEPFHLKMMGVGNEQWGPQYIERYARFAKALKGKYPEIMLVSASGPSPDDDRFKFLWSKLRELHADIVDEHCYANPSWFFNNTHRYDHYDRAGPKVFMGEYAAQSVGVVSVKNRNTLECALAEAAYMTGLERNADVVRMASYAPLFANAQAWQWTPDMIWVNSLQSFATPDYYAQMLFSRNRGSVVLPVSYDNATAGGAAPSFFVSAARDDADGEIILKAVNASLEPVEAAVDLDGVATVSTAGQALVLSSAKLTDQNSFEEPAKVSPKSSALENVTPQFNYSFEPRSLTVLRVRATMK